MPISVTTVNASGQATPAGDAAARSIFVEPSDGTNTIVITTANAAVAEQTSTWLKTVSALYAFDSAAGAGSKQVPLTVVSTAVPQLKVAAFDGANQFKSGSATNLSAQSSVNAMLVIGPGEWGINNQATAGTPTISKAAGGGSVRHVATGICISVSSGGTAQTPVVVNLRDGATGAGTILQSWALSAPVNTVSTITDKMNVVGSANTAMTLEFASTTATAVIGSVNLRGYDCV